MKGARELGFPDKKLVRQLTLGVDRGDGGWTTARGEPRPTVTARLPGFAPESQTRNLEQLQASNFQACNRRAAC